MSESYLKEDLENALRENAKLKSKLSDAEETLNAIRNGEVDAIVVSGKNGDKIFSLASAETPYRIIIEEMDEGAVTVTSKGIILYNNPSFARMVSLPAEKITGSDFSRFISENDKTKFSKLLKTCLKRRSREVVRAAFDGKQYYLQLSCVSLPAEMEGDICIIVSDITELRDYQDHLYQMVEDSTAELIQTNEQLEINFNSLREAEENYRDLVENSGSIIMKADRDFNITFMNDYGLDFFGYKIEELIGKNVIGTTIPKRDDSGKDLEAMVLDMRNQPLLYSSNVHQNMRKNGELVWVSWTNKLRYDSNGKFIEILAIGNDINKLIKTEEALKESENKAAMIIKYAPTGIYELDYSGPKFLSVNDAMSEITGYSRDELMSMNPFQLLDDTSALKFKDRIRRILAGEKIEDNVEFKVRVKGGRELYAALNVKIITNDSTQPHALVIAHDITERKYLESELRKYNETLEERVRQRSEQIITEQENLQKLNEDLLRSNKELESFAYITSHDLQEPLRMVTSFTQILAQRYEDQLDGDAKEYVSYIVEGAKRMYDLINGLLDYSRISRKEITFSKVHLNNIVEIVKSNLDLAIKEKNCEIDSKNLPIVFADNSQMIQLFQNLIANGIKFSNNNSHIVISSKREDSNYVFSVRDEGIGIESQYFDKIFEIFKRLNPREKFEGTGIGLSICKKIVENHKGKIWVESEPGKGSVFYFTLPVKS